jgi:hypothetical protein
VANEVINALVYLFDLLLVSLVRLFHRGADGRALAVSVLEGLVLHLNGDVALLEKGQRGVVDAVLPFSKIHQFEEIILQNLGPLFLHVDLLRVPIAKLAVVNPQLRFRIARKSQDILAIWTGIAKGAFTVLYCVFVHSFA